MLCRTPLRNTTAAAVSVSRSRTRPWPSRVGRIADARLSADVHSRLRTAVDVVELNDVGARSAGRRGSWSAVDLAIRKHLTEDLPTIAALVHILQQEKAGEAQDGKI